MIIITLLLSVLLGENIPRKLYKIDSVVSLFPIIECIIHDRTIRIFSFFADDASQTTNIRSALPTGINHKTNWR